MIGRRVSSKKVRNRLWISKDKHLGPEAGRDLICASIGFLPVAIHRTEVKCVEKFPAHSENEAFAGWAPELGRVRATGWVDPESKEEDNAGRDSDFHICPISENLAQKDLKCVVDGGEVEHWRNRLRGVTVISLQLNLRSIVRDVGSGLGLALDNFCVVMRSPATFTGLRPHTCAVLHSGWIWPDLPTVSMSRTCQ